MRGAGVVACALGCALGGCAGGSSFSCEDDTQCDPAAGGRCEPSGFCSFPDPDCPSGQRYGAHAGFGLAMACVDPVGSEGSGESTGAPASSGSGGGPPDPSSSSTTAPIAEDSTGEPPACPDWWDCAWVHRREVLVAGDVIAAPLDDFPVPVTLDDVSDPSRFGPDGLDLRVVGEDGTPLAFDVDTWGREAPALLWVRVPRIEQGPGARFHLYYGRPDAPPLDTGPETWEPGFAAVWHLGDGDDATANGNHAEDQGSSPTVGIFGGARSFDAEDQRLLVPPSRSLADLPVEGITVTALIAPLSAAVVGNGRILDTADHTAATLGLTILTNATASGLEFNRGATDEGSWIAQNSLDFGRWQHLALTFVDGEVPVAFLDAQPVEWSTLVDPIGVPASDLASPISIGGAAYDATHTFDGTIDELRVSRGVRSQAWLFAEHLASLGQLVTLGPEENAPR